MWFMVDDKMIVCKVCVFVISPLNCIIHVIAIDLHNSDNPTDQAGSWGVYQSYVLDIIQPSMFSDFLLTKGLTGHKALAVGERSLVTRELPPPFTLPEQYTEQTNQFENLESTPVKLLEGTIGIISHAFLYLQAELNVLEGFG